MTEVGTAPDSPDPVENGFRHGATNEEGTTSMVPSSPEGKESETEAGVSETPITEINSSSDTSLSPILVTPILNSSTEPPSPPRTDVRRRLIDEFTSSVTRGRVYSLDTGRDMLTSLDANARFHSSATSELTVDDLDLTPRKQNGPGTRAARLHHTDDDDDLSLGSHSSDGESSYFAKNLPSPRSGRRFSYDAGSISSAPARAGFYNGSLSSLKIESDASLSFSDDDDDSVTDEEERRQKTVNMLPGRAPMLLPPVRRSSPMYPQRITRAHSVSSLMSSGSDNDRPDQKENVQNDTSPGRRSSFSSTSTLGASSASGASRSPDDDDSPTGSDQDALSTNAVGDSSADVTDLQQDSSTELVHPPPPPPERGAWAGYPNSHLGPMPHHFVHPGLSTYGSTSMLPPGADMRMNAPQLSSSSEALDMSTSGGELSRGDGSVPMVYSEDDDSLPFGHRVADGIGMTGPGQDHSMFTGVPPRQGGGSDQGRYDDRMYGRQASGQAEVGNKAKTDSSKIQRSDSAFSASSANKEFKVYWQRWLMLFYMSILNLLSDWTCYSVAPIAVLTMGAFGSIDPEQLVVVFLGANVVATACEPIVLSRLGLRRTVLLGALLLMVGSMVKSGGLPPIIESNLEKGKGEWRVYVGFFLVGLSQPLYQCTPALLSASWFPERERTMATGVALNANQLGIGFAFIFGTLLVATSDDIVPYFGLLSIISTITFIGCLIQFDDAPPTPPSDTARAMRGDLQLNFPEAVDNIWRSVRSLGNTGRNMENIFGGSDQGSASSEQQQMDSSGGQKRRSSKDRGSRRASRSSRSRSRSSSPLVTSSNQARHSRQLSGGSKSRSGTRRRSGSSKNHTASTENGLSSGQPNVAMAPAPSPTDAPTLAAMAKAQNELDAYRSVIMAPSPMMPGPVGGAFAPAGGAPPGQGESPLEEETDLPGRRGSADDDDALPLPQNVHYAGPPPPSLPYQHPMPPYPQWPPGYVNPNLHPSGFVGPPGFHPQLPPPMGYQQPYGYYPGQGYYSSQGYYYQPQGPYPYPPQAYNPYNPYYFYAGSVGASSFDEGLEPEVTITPHNLDIHIRDDQVILSTRACLSRPGFIHALVSFTVSGIVINTLSTFMDYLVRLNGAGREYVGIVGGSFQFCIMISSLIIGKLTDRTRAYYFVTMCMLVFGAFALAECGVDLDADRGGDLRWSLIIVAVLVGPLQPVSTELGVEVAYPLSENTVLVIQQLFSNLLSALFIPFFKALKDVGTLSLEDVESYEKPQYTFSFYLLILIHATATVFVATFNGQYLRYMKEQEKKKLEQQNHGEQNNDQPPYGGPMGETQPLVSSVV